MNKEIWKEIKDFDNLYQVSNYGRVRSIRRFKNKNNENAFYVKKYLKLSLQSGKKYPYLRVVLSKNGKRYCFTVHRLVMLAFKPNKKHKELSINHIDCNKHNNCVDNLEWYTASQNMKHASENNLLNIKKGFNHNMVKITEEKALTLITCRHYFTNAYLAKKLDLKEATISAFYLNKNFKHLGYLK